MAKIKAPPLDTYGAPVEHLTTQQEIEWWCFLRRWPGGPGPAEHFIRAFKMTWPRVIWSWTDPETGEEVENHWMHAIVRAALDDTEVVQMGQTRAKYIVLSGVGAAGKTFACACLSMGWWAPSPANSIVCLTSTTKEMIGRRIWSVISMLHGTMVWGGKKRVVGDIIDSQRIICATDSRGKRDFKHAISAMAVAHGETQKAAHNLRGLHAERILVIVDEANGTPEAIYETIPNWAKACQDLTVILIGNPISHLDPHGRAMEPSDPTTSPTSYRWRTKRIPNWDFGPGAALRFDGRDSPNVLFGKTIFPFLYTLEDWDKARALNENTLAFWSQHRGLHPPEGLLSSVLNETALANARVDEPLVLHTANRCAFLDPAFGGDAAVVVFGVCGRTEDGRTSLQLKERVEIPILVAEPGHYIDEPDIQVAKAFVGLCKERSIPPANAGIDATGTGRGVYAFVVTLWSPEVFRFEAGSSPPDAPVLDGDSKNASDLYLNLVTSSWVLAASLTRSGQLKGLDQRAKVEFTTRVFHDRLVRGLRRLEDKDDFKSRLGHSPDDADAVAGICELARMRLDLALIGVHPGSTDPERAWKDLSETWNRVYEDHTEADNRETDPFGTILSP